MMVLRSSDRFPLIFSGVAVECIWDVCKGDKWEVNGVNVDSVVPSLKGINKIGSIYYLEASAIFSFNQ